MCVFFVFTGFWPLGLIMCDMWQVCDVMMCTSSIMHMCIISMDRYMAIRNPLKTRNKSRVSVAIKVATVWLISLAIASPLIVLCILKPHHILNQHYQCAIFNNHFLIYGSLTAFFIPLTIMIVSYTLTIQLLRQQAINSSRQERDGIRRTFSTKKARLRTGLKKKLSSRQSESSHVTNANGYNKKVCTEIDRKLAEPSEIEPLTIPQVQTRKQSAVSIVTTLTALNSPRPSVGSNNNQQLENITIKTLCSPRLSVNSTQQHQCDSCINYTGNKPCDSYLNSTQCKSCENTKLRACDLCLKSTRHRSSDSSLNSVHHKSCDLCLQNTQFKSCDSCVTTTQHKSCDSCSKSKESQSNELCYKDQNQDRQSGSTQNLLPDIPNDLHPNGVSYCQGKLSNTTHSESSSPAASQNTILPATQHQLHSSSLPQTQPVHKTSIPNCEQSHNTKKIQEPAQSHDTNETLTSEHRKSCSDTPKFIYLKIPSKSKSKSEADIFLSNNISTDDTVKSNLAKLSLLGVRSQDEVNKYCVVPDNSLSTQLQIPPHHHSGHTPGSIIQKAIRKLSWTKIVKSAENQGETEASDAENRPPNMKFRQLMQKHRAAFKVAGILMAKREEKNKVKTERKAIKVLGTMFVTFFMCWAPFFLTNFTMGICQTCDIDVFIFKLFLWFGYFGSTVNPIIYTVFNKTFRKAFIKLLTCGHYKDRCRQSDHQISEKPRPTSAQETQTFTTSSKNYSISTDLQKVYSQLRETHL